MGIIILIIWFVILLLFIKWEHPHTSGKFYDAIYYPHISHSIVWCYVGLTHTVLSFIGVKPTNGGSLVILLFAFWQFWRAIRLFSAYRKNETVRF